MTVLSLHASGPAWDDDDVLAHAEQVARARTQSRRLAGAVAALPLPQVRTFLRRLWEHAGTVDPLGAAAPSLLVEAALAADVAALLRRLGVGCEQVPDQGQVRVQVTGDDRMGFLRAVAMARASEAAFAPAALARAAR